MRTPGEGILTRPRRAPILAGMFTLGLVGDVHGFDPLILLVIALVLEAYVGEMRFVFSRIRHPVQVIGSLVAYLDDKLNRDKRSQMDRAVRGLAVVLIVGGLCGAVGWAIAWASLHHTFGWLLETVLLVTLVAQRGLYDSVRAVALALHKSGLEAGRDAVSHIVGRDPRQLDEHAVARAAIESLAENFSDAVVAPVFWYVLFGFPGLLVYKAVNTMDSMIGYRSEKYRAFGMAAARMDDIVNLIPARLSGLFIVLAAIFVPKANPARAMGVMLRDAGKHRSPNAGWPEGAMAGAFGLSLAGPRRYSHGVVEDPWINPQGRARATVEDIRRALYLYAVACLINGLIVSALMVVRFNL